MAVSVDSATCDDCLHEVDDPDDRRHGYPFTNCTNCGPRYTIVLSVPYDRPATTMAGFQMCAQCQAEYDDPANRRFHAQPNACANCGPQISFYDPSGRLLAEPARRSRLCEALCTGRIAAVKGIGGYHLAVTRPVTRRWRNCDAAKQETTSRSRSWWRTSKSLGPCACWTPTPSPPSARWPGPSCWPREDRAPRSPMAWHQECPTWG